MTQKIKDMSKWVLKHPKLISSALGAIAALLKIIEFATHWHTLS